MSDLRAITAHHEAGHAIAAVMRGDSELRSVSLSETHGAGITWHRSKPSDGGFIAYAGPWAEARFEWGNRPLDSEDEEWLTFDDYVTGVILEQGNSDEALIVKAEEEVEAMLASLPERPEVAPLTTTWDRELERVWPAVQMVAQLLLEDHAVTDADVRSIVEGQAGR